MSKRFPRSAISCLNPARRATNITGQAMDRSPSPKSAVIAALAAMALLAAPLAAQQAAPIVLHTSTEQIPLKAYAELMRTGVMRIVSGSERDIPTVPDVSYFR